MGRRRRPLVRCVIGMSYRLNERLASERRNDHGQTGISDRFDGAAAATRGAPAIVRAATEISFYYPVAVGGPITKIIDGYAADFEKENPGIKVKPIYAGTYQETIVKALTAPQVRHAAGDLRSAVHRYVLAHRRGRDRAVRRLAKSDAEKSWIKSFFPAFMENSRTGGKTWGIPFQRSTIVLYWNKEAFKEAGLDPEKPPAIGPRDRIRAEAHQARRARATRRSGACRFRPPAFPTGCSRRSRPRTTSS